MTLFDAVSQDVSLKIRGREAWGCCPFHSEKTPSFSVNMEKGLFHCFSCGQGGDLITYLMKHRGLSFRDAAKLAGKELPESERERQARERAVKQDLITRYFAWYHKKLAAECDRFQALIADREEAEIGYRATVRCPDLYTDEEKDFWERRIAAVYDELPVVEHRLDILPYDHYEQERLAWWREER